MIETILPFVVLRFKYRAIIIFVIAFLASILAFNPVLEIAKKKNLVDCPDARKLQKKPVPVVGGLVVFFGIVVGLSFFKTMHVYTALFPVICAMTIMLYVGCVDDIIEIRPWKRLLIEVFVSLLCIFGSSFIINNFQGMWGVDVLPRWLALTLTVITYVGIINAMNMIDGIDGLSSAFSIMILTCFAVIFFLAHEFSFCALAIVAVASILPFFLHNVFGLHTKMFIGDGGTMMIGSIVAVMISAVLDSRLKFPLWPQLDFSRIALVVAVLAIPVADALRVMFMRIVNHKSPFFPDKRHLHHYLLKVGFPHIAITVAEIFMGLVVIASFVISWRFGASLEWQLYIVIMVAALFDFGIPALIDIVERRNPQNIEKIRKITTSKSVERKGIWFKIQKLIDGKKYYSE